MVRCCDSAGTLWPAGFTVISWWTWHPDIYPLASCLWDCCGEEQFCSGFAWSMRYGVSKELQWVQLLFYWNIFMLFWVFSWLQISCEAVSCTWSQQGGDFWAWCGDQCVRCRSLCQGSGVGLAAGLPCNLWSDLQMKSCPDMVVMSLSNSRKDCTIFLLVLCFLSCVSSCPRTLELRVRWTRS